MKRYIDKASLKEIREIRSAMESWHQGNGGTDAILAKALLEFAKGREPRNAFISSARLLQSILDAVAKPDTLMPLSRLPGFEDGRKASDHICMLIGLMQKMSDWKVDGYINLLRLREAKRTLTKGEVLALAEMYIHGNGCNTVPFELNGREGIGHDPLERCTFEIHGEEEIIMANHYHARITEAAPDFRIA